MSSAPCSFRIIDLQKVQKEAVEYSKVAKKDLAKEVRQLYKFLKEAKEERLQQDIDIAEWESALSSAIRDNEQASRKFEMDRCVHVLSADILYIHVSHQSALIT
jgi:hypothetical protein